MLRVRTRLLLLAVVLVGSLLAVSAGPIAAQEAPYQVWYMSPTESDPLSHIEIRDSSGSVVVSYTLTIDAFDWPQYGGGILYGINDIQYGGSSEMVPLFDPTVGQIVFQQLEGMQAGPGQYGFVITQFAAHPAEPIYAYGIYERGMDSGQSWIYVNSPGQASARLVFTDTSENLTAASPFAWGSDGNTLIIEDDPQENAGYGPRRDNVRALDITTGAIRPLGDVVSLSPDLYQSTTYEYDDDHVVLGLTVHHIESGAATLFALPSLEESSILAGRAVFSPDKSKVAYQVARSYARSQDIGKSKMWTIVADLVRGESRVVLEDERDGFRFHYGVIAGWLDNDTLAVGSSEQPQSAVIDVPTGTFLREAPGSFLGFATDLTGFAPSGVIYAACPDAPVSRLMTQMRGRLAFTDGSPTNVRSWPGLDGGKTATWPEGTAFTVLSGPTCADGYAWWDLEFDDGSHGYVAEGDPQAYYLEPWPTN